VLRAASGAKGSPVLVLPRFGPSYIGAGGPQIRPMPQSTRPGTVLEETAGSVVVSILGEELAQRLSSDPSVRQRYLHGDDADAIEEEAIAAACARADVTPEDYWMTLEADALLLELHRATLTEATVGTADPGPDDRW